MITIAEFRTEHADALFSISLATGHMGGDASHLYADPRLMGLIYSAPYAALEPSLTLLAMDDEGVVGFAVGVADTAVWEDRLEREWWPPLRARYPDPDRLPSSEWTPDQRRLHMIHHPTRVPQAISKAYPAHLHMNLLPRAQGSGLGLRLFNAWLERVPSRSPAGVHVGVNRHNERAVRFWKKAGFSELELDPSQQGRTVWMGRPRSDP